jgi:hypothetical protein
LRLTTGIFCCFPGWQVTPQLPGVSAEQLAMYQQHLGIMGAFAMAGQAAFSGAMGATSAAEGLPVNGGAGALAGLSMPFGAGSLDPAQQLLAAQMAVAAQAAAFPLPLPLASGPPPAQSQGVTTTNPRNDRHFWKEAEQHELLRLVADQAYRQSVLGALGVALPVLVHFLICQHRRACLLLLAAWA